MRPRRKSKLLQQALRILPNECAVCGCEGQLELDHIVPISMGGDDDMSNVQLLCHNHHRQKTNRQRNQRMMKVNNDGTIVPATFPAKPITNDKLAGSRSRFSGRQTGW